jgi:hypothetical protein
LPALKMLRIFLFGLAKRRKQPERYTQFFAPNLSPQPPSVATEICCFLEDYVMKKMVFCIIALLVAVIACASKSGPVTRANAVPAVVTSGYSSEADRKPAEDEVILAQLTTPGMDLDATVREAAAQMERRLPAATKVALVSVASPSTAFSTQVLTRLESVLVSSGKLVVVDRANLDKIREEQGFQLSGEVDDESAKSIGKLLGAGAIVTGTLADLGDVYSLTLKAINIETATVAVSYLADLAKTARIETLLASGITAPAASGSGRRASVPAQSPAATADRVYKVGDTGPAGGIIFYVNPAVGDGWRYLEAAPARTEVSSKWTTEEIPTIDINGSRTVGSGKTNSEYLMMQAVQRGGGFGWAAQACDELEVNGFDDWFLPSRDELNMMWGALHRRGLGGFKSEWYWSSTATRDDGQRAIAQNFSDGNVDTDDDHRRNGNNYYPLIRRVRAIRQF